MHSLLSSMMLAAMNSFQYGVHGKNVVGYPVSNLESCLGLHRLALCSDQALLQVII